MALKGNKSDLHRGKIEIGFSSFMIIQKWKGDVKKFSEFCWQWRIGGWEVLRRGWGWRNGRPQEMKRGREGVASAQGNLGLSEYHRSFAVKNTEFSNNQAVDIRTYIERPRMDIDQASAS